MSVDDRVGLVAHVVSRDDKLSRTFSVPVHASVQNVSQVWRAGPLLVRLGERDGETCLVVEVRCVDLLDAVGLKYGRIRDWVQAMPVLRWECVEVAGYDVPQQMSVVRWELPFTPALDRFLVELVDVIADVRRAAGTVQLELDGLEEVDDGDDGVDAGAVGAGGGDGR